MNANWVVVSYLLTYTGFMIIYARFSDVFGRKSALLVAIGFFGIFSLACGWGIIYEAAYRFAPLPGDRSVWNLCNGFCVCSRSGTVQVPRGLIGVDWRCLYIDFHSRAYTRWCDCPLVFMEMDFLTQVSCLYYESVFLCCNISTPHDAIPKDTRNSRIYMTVLTFSVSLALCGSSYLLPCFILPIRHGLP